MTRQNPGRSWAPGQPTHNPNSISPHRTYLSYSDRVRNMARAGKGGSGYAGILRGNTSVLEPNSPTPPQNRDPAPNCACAHDLFSPPSCACLLLVGRNSSQGDWANGLPLPASVGQGRAGQGSFFRFKLQVVAGGAGNQSCAVRVPVLEKV